MRRDLQAMGGKTYDVLIVGCGIYGAFTAREAALRGLSVALIDKKDFCGATSANSLKIIHGGLRYLQQLDFKRVMESAHERKILMQIAPHLVHPLPCAMPTRGFALRSKPAMFAGMLLNDILTCDRNKDIDPEKKIPGGKIVSRDEFLQMVPGITDERFNGAAVWHDALAYSTERLVVTALKAAVMLGADAANYAEMTGFVKDGKKVAGVIAKDIISGREVAIKASLVINNTGPWSNEALALLGEQVTLPAAGQVLELNFVLKRQILKKHAVGLTGYRKSDAKERLLFFVPWHGRTMVGTYCRIHAGRVDEAKVQDHDIDAFLEDINNALPSAKITRADISLVHWGILPMEQGSENWAAPEPARHYRLLDHGEKDGIQGLLTVQGVKYTTARDVAEKTITQVLEKLGKRDGSVSKSAVTPLPGGDIPDFNRFLNDAKATAPAGLSDAAFANLLYSYGTEYRLVLDIVKPETALLRLVGDSPCVIAAEVVNAVRNEMAQTLADVVFRRTDLGAAGIPDDETLKACASIMARECGWDNARVEKEVGLVRAAAVKVDVDARY